MRYKALICFLIDEQYFIRNTRESVLKTPREITRRLGSENTSRTDTVYYRACALFTVVYYYFLSSTEFPFSCDMSATVLLPFPLSLFFCLTFRSRNVLLMISKTPFKNISISRGRARARKTLRNPRNSRLYSGKQSFRNPKSHVSSFTEPSTKSLDLRANLNDSKKKKKRKRNENKKTRRRAEDARREFRHRAVV